MAAIKTIVRTEIIDFRGERFVIERELSKTSAGDNPRFWSEQVEQEIHAAEGTIVEAVAHQFGNLRTSNHA